MAGAGIEFHPLSFVADGGDVVVGRVETGTYAVLPGDGAALLRRLSGGSSVDEAAAWYEHSFGEPVDIEDFVESLTELGFVREPGGAGEGATDAADGLAAGAAARTVTSAGIASTSAGSAAKAPRFQPLARLLFSAPAWLVYAGLVAAALVALVRHPDLRPASSQVYFTSSLTTVELVLLFGQVPLAFLHESYHVLAGQRLGLHSGLGISNRYNYVVFETRTNGLFSVPRRRRYLPFLAGMLVDAVALAALDLVAAALRRPDGSIPVLGRVCLALAFSIATRLVWQLLLHLRTDLYYVLSTALNCYDLHEASKAILANRVRRLRGRTDRLVDETQWTDRDRRIGAWYGWFLALGFTATVALLVLTAPVAATFLVRTVRGVAAGPGTWHFWDSLVSLLIFAVQFALPAVLAWRKRRRPGTGRKHSAGRRPKPPAA